MQVFINKITGETVAIDTDPSDTVENVYWKISSGVKGDIYDQRLIYAGQTLSYGSTLGDYNIQPGSTIIHLLLLRGGAITLMVQSVGSGARTITVHLEPTDTIGRLKELIRDKLEPKVAVDHQVLLFGPQQLTDNKKLISDYELRHGSTIQLIIRLPGGGCGPVILT